MTPPSLRMASLAMSISPSDRSQTRSPASVSGRSGIAGPSVYRKRGPHMSTDTSRIVPLGVTDRQHLEQVLLDERACFLRHHDQLCHEINDGGVSVACVGADMVDWSSVVASRATTRAAADRGLNQLHKIETALAQLRSAPDRFGLCHTCGHGIAIERLEIVPTTDTCARCARR